MSASAARKAAPAKLREGVSLWNSRAQAVSVAQKLIQRHEKMVQAAEAEAAERAAETSHQRLELVKSFSFHLGADINVPTSSTQPNHTKAAVGPVEAPSDSNPFAGLPLQAWAERLGERIMPAYELIKEEQKRSKSMPRPAVAAAPTYTVPHLLPFTRWAANNQSIRNTFVAEDAKTRKKARMSWYHPDDTMVPRDWFKGGLLEDLKYYSPFSAASAPEK